jgi:methylmalonyl-CoA/ethylmalonyl-CoA epimerase
MKPRGLNMPRVGQIGIVVKDIEKTIRYYQDIMGIGPWALFEGEPEWCLEGGKKVTYKGRMALASSGPIQFELIQILEGRSLYGDTLGEGEGLHHLGFFVRDMDARLQAARAAGVPVLQHALLKRRGLTIEYAYLDTTATGGVITEYIKTSFLGLPFPLNRGPLARLSAWAAAIAG